MHMGIPTQIQLPTQLSPAPPMRVHLNPRLRSQSLVVDDNNSRLLLRRGSLQRQHSMDMSGSNTILEEMTTTSSSDNEREEDSRSYLSAKRASLRKRLKLRTLPSKSEEKDQKLKVTSL